MHIDICKQGLSVGTRHDPIDSDGANVLLKDVTPSKSALLDDEHLMSLILDDSLLRLYRTGANLYKWTAEEDDMYDVS